jgi:hypothetical protein
MPQQSAKVQQLRRQLLPLVPVDRREGAQPALARARGRVELRPGQLIQRQQRAGQLSKQLQQRVGDQVRRPAVPPPAELPRVAAQPSHEDRDLRGVAAAGEKPADVHRRLHQVLSRHGLNAHRPANIAVVKQYPWILWPHLQQQVQGRCIHLADVGRRSRVHDGCARRAIAAACGIRPWWRCTTAPATSWFGPRPW